MANKFREIPKNQEELEELQEITSSIPQKEEKTSKPRKKGVLAKALGAVFSGTFLANDKAIKNVPFILFLAVIAIVYIANGYYADGVIRETNKLNGEIKEYRTEFISTTSDLMFKSKQSEVAKAVDSLGLKEPVAPPMIIEIDTTLTK